MKLSSGCKNVQEIAVHLSHWEKHQRTRKELGYHAKKNSCNYVATRSETSMGLTRDQVQVRKKVENKSFKVDFHLQK